MARAKAKSLLSIPMWIDDIKKAGSFKMTRLSYFVAEADEPTDDCAIMLGKANIPVIICGFSVAICQPSGAKQRFESATELDKLFDYIEDECDLSIETPDIWLPNGLFKSKHTPKRGDVYRIKQKLFTTALAFRTGRSNQQDFEEWCAKSSEKVTYSDKETTVFAEWSTMQTERAKEKYEKEKLSGRYMEY
ncbi:MAG TPA: hypothetical protein DIU00_17460 [Phycisphaerales bacterium]|nr:hypothetical protein [Phycisphaerales bacterium]